MQPLADPEARVKALTKSLISDHSIGIHWRGTKAVGTPLQRVYSSLDFDVTHRIRQECADKEISG